MLRYFTNRIMQGILVILIVTFLIYFIMDLMPGDPILLIAGDRASPQQIEQIRQEWQLDSPVVVRYFTWLTHLVQGDMGMSITTSRPAAELIMSRLPYTLMLSGGALLISYLIAIPIGLIAAYKKGTILDYTVVATSIIFWSIPSFWLSILLMLTFSIKLGILPLSGYMGITSLILPVTALALPNLASVIRMTRSEVLEVLREKMVTTAYAKGLTESQVLLRHVLRNALIPTTVLFFLSLPWVIGGSVVVEKIFAWPGMGQLLWKSITMQDFPVVQGIIVVIAILTVVSNIMGELITGFLDPRISRELYSNK